MLKRLLRFSGFKLGLIITLVYCILKLWIVQDLMTWDLHDNIENELLDLKFTSRGERDPEEFQKNAHVVIAAIDELSMRHEDLGMWPWPRSKIGDMVTQLNKCGARVVGFDVVFSEPDASRTAPVVKSIRQKYKEQGDGDKDFADFLEKTVVETQFDERFAKVLEETENVVLGFFLFQSLADLEGLDTNEVTKEAVDILSFGSGYRLLKHRELAWDETGLHEAFGARVNLPVLSDAVEYYGFFNFIAESDGVFRRAPLLFLMTVEQEDGKKNTEVFPSLSLQMLALYYGQPIQIFIDRDNVGNRKEGYQALFIGPYGPIEEEHVAVPVEHRGMINLNFYGGPQTFKHISAADIIHGKQNACSAVKDKLVLVGATAVGLYDLRATPFAESYPGVELHATAIENVITGEFLERPIDLGLVEVLCMLIIGLLSSFILTRLRLTTGLLVTLFLFGAMAGVDFLVLFPNGFLAHLFIAYLMLLSQFLSISVYRYATEERQKRETRRAFQFYLSKDVIDSVLQDDSKLELGGERRELTVLFSDIRGFTTISEGLAPEALTALLNEYLTPMTDLVFAHKGTLDKYMGDAVMAFYGAPVAYDDHPQAACRTALEMMSELRKMQQSWRERGVPEIDIGIGLNTGMMSVGNMGSVNRFDYTVMGDHVNLGSRLEGINKTYGTNIIISEFTQAAVAKDFTCRELDAVAVKGKKEPVRIFELVHEGGPVAGEDDWIARSEEALALYKSQRWDEATAIFAQLAEERQDRCAKMFVERCQDMKAKPPGADWDGVFKMLTK